MMRLIPFHFPFSGVFRKAEVLLLAHCLAFSKDSWGGMLDIFLFHGVLRKVEDLLQAHCFSFLTGRFLSRVDLFTRYFVVRRVVCEVYSWVLSEVIVVKHVPIQVKHAAVRNRGVCLCGIFMRIDSADPS